MRDLVLSSYRRPVHELRAQGDADVIREQDVRNDQRFVRDATHARVQQDRRLHGSEKHSRAGEEKVADASVDEVKRAVAPNLGRGDLAVKVQKETAYDVRVRLGYLPPQRVVALLYPVPLRFRRRAVRRVEPVREQLLHRARLAGGLVREAQASRAEVADRGPAQDADDLRGAAAVVADREDVRDPGREVEELVDDPVERRPAREAHERGLVVSDAVVFAISRALVAAAARRAGFVRVAAFQRGRREVDGRGGRARRLDRARARGRAGIADATLATGSGNSSVPSVVASRRRRRRDARGARRARRRRDAAS
mmetsp:Transcript_2461/g.7836  ORF Transcript_2461/g.7836 Transcript_2461/m.7836 type:complete len:311 (+) Transcript_2461:960-1892(+)